MSYIEDKYISLISVRLNKLSKKNKAYNFRCPYCGDSQKHQNKTRGYLYSIKDTYNYKCHNCGISCSFSSFLKYIDSTLHNQYIFERFRDNTEDKLVPKIIIKDKSPPLDVEYFDLPTIDSLDESHFARYYLENRKIPKDKLKTLYFCEKFKEWTNTKKYTFKQIKYDEPRIIIPLVYQNKIFGFQGRSLNRNSNVKYITIILNENIPKIYGLDDVDWSKNIYVLEGPFDSMFISNSIAMVGADINISSIPNYQQTDFVFIYDNEPRNKEIVSRMNSVIESGYSIVVWPKDLKYKDVNLMIENGINPVEIIKNNTFLGLEAKVKLLGWKRV